MKTLDKGIMSLNLGHTAVKIHNINGFDTERV